jgi:Tol biopolymer transport system component
LGDVHLLSVAGGVPSGEPRQLTFAKDFIEGLDWTADGQSLVFSLGPDRSKSLWTVAVSGGKPQRLGERGENAKSLSVARRGNRLVYTQTATDLNIWQFEGLGPAGQVSTRKTPLPVRLIASTKLEGDPQFSPDGQQITFLSDRSGHQEIWVCDRDGSNPVQITNVGGGELGSPRWSPDGRQIAFDSTKEGNWDIYVSRVEGGLPRRLTTDTAVDVRPSWSRDGLWVYFGSNRSGDYQLWKVPSQGGSAVQVTRKGGWEAFEAPDGHWLYYTHPRGDEGIWRVPVEGGEESQVLDHGQQCFWAVGDTGIFLLNPERGQVPNIEFYSFATNRLSEVARLGKNLAFDLETGSLAVSRDGGWILYLAADKTESDLVLVENFR